jgi:hypothetical protein
MEMNGQLYTPVVLTPGNKPHYPVTKRLCGPQTRSGWAPDLVWVGPRPGLGGPQTRSGWAPDQVWVCPRPGLGGPQTRSGCAPDLVWTFWRSGKSLPLTRIERFLGCPGRSTVTILTELPQPILRLISSFTDKQINLLLAKRNDLINHSIINQPMQHAERCL